jgi:hypothetical protein
LIKNDYIMRLIEQVVRAIARMLQLTEKGEFDQAIKKADDVYDMLGVNKDLLDAMDTPSLANLLGHPDKMRLVARVCREEARVHKMKGDPLSAQNRNRKALELFLEARAADPQPDDYDDIAQLVDKVPQDVLDSRYRVDEASA